MKKISILGAFGLMTFGCAHAAPVGKLPPWLETRIASYEALAASIPPRSSLSVSYEGKPAFYVSPACCDIPSELYDESGRLLCFPAGGFAGGDGRCPTFAMPQKSVTLWRDPRTPKAVEGKAVQK